jgi:hypothetical protein
MRNQQIHKPVGRVENLANTRHHYTQKRTKSQACRKVFGGKSQHTTFAVNLIGRLLYLCFCLF